jgi:hypothetical protein
MEFQFPPFFTLTFNRYFVYLKRFGQMYFSHAKEKTHKSFYSLRRAYLMA